MTDYTDMFIMQITFNVLDTYSKMYILRLHKTYKYSLSYYVRNFKFLSRKITNVFIRLNIDPIQKGGFDKIVSTQEAAKMENHSVIVEHLVWY